VIRDERQAYPDPYVTLEQDRAEAAALAERSGALDLRGLLEEFWRGSGKPPELVERFVAHDLAAERKSEEVLAAVEAELGRPLAGLDVLEVGCGTAALSAAAARRGARVTASDVSARWLVLAGKRLEGLGVELVACAAEEAPFPDESFDVLLASDVIEHVADPAAFVAGCRRLLRPGGVLFLATPNRFSLGLEPHVRLPLVGWLPRGLAKRYVETVRKAPYDHVRLLSARDLRRLLAGFRVRIVPPEIPPTTVELYHGVERRLVEAYNRLRQPSPARRLLLAVGPFFHVFATKGAP
jgi:2-polyprenyl-6-hydroxyphenyl methylase/3-demethylubiquinone-9 3-methyltransferase